MPQGAGLRLRSMTIRPTDLTPIQIRALIKLDTPGGAEGL